MRLPCPSCGTVREVAAPEGEGPFPDAMRALAATVLCDECAGAEERAVEERAAAEAHRARLERSGLPERLRGIGWDSWEETRAVAAAREWSSGDLEGLMLFGGVGVGKTWLAATAIREAARRRRVRWTSAARLLIGLRAGFSDDERRRANELLSGRGALAIDDLDKASPTEYGREVLFALIDGRIEQGDRILVTTNLSPEALEERYGAAIVSRLAGFCRTIRMSGEDRRLHRDAS